MDRPDLCQVAVRRGQERVEDAQTEILFVDSHLATLPCKTAKSARKFGKQKRRLLREATPGDLTESPSFANWWLRFVGFRSRASTVTQINPYKSHKRWKLALCH